MGCRPSGVFDPRIGVCCFFSIFSALGFCWRSLRAVHRAGTQATPAAPGVVFSFLLSISHRPAAMEIASALNLVAQPQTEEPAARLGCFHIFFLSGVRHCNITASRPACDRVWEERASRTREARCSPGPQAGPTSGCLGNLSEHASQTKMLPRCPSARHQRRKGRDLGPFWLPQVGHLAPCCATLPAGTSVVCSQGPRRVPGMGSLFSGAKRRPNSSTFLPNGDLSCPRDLGYCPRVASVQLSLLDAHEGALGLQRAASTQPG